jgi:hypothetical protein
MNDIQKILELIRRMSSTHFRHNKLKDIFLMLIEKSDRFYNEEDTEITDLSYEIRWSSENETPHIITILINGLFGTYRWKIRYSDTTTIMWDDQNMPVHVTFHNFLSDLEKEQRLRISKNIKSILND